MRGKISAASIAMLIVGVIAAPSGASSDGGERYSGGGTVAVVQLNGVTVIDNGAAVCRPGGESTGGVCLPFGGDRDRYVGITDDTSGPDVAFQVCIDNNGDGVCGGEAGAGGLRCGDDQFFSHREDGSFANPIGPLPVSFRKGCEGGGYAGYIIFLCTGVHSNDVDGPHQHTADAGTARVRSGQGDQFGSFCGGGGAGGSAPPATGVLQAKPYIVE